MIVRSSAKLDPELEAAPKPIPGCIHFFIPCVPVPKARPRFTRKGWAYSPKSNREFEQAVTDYAYGAMPLDFGRVEKPESVQVELLFTLPVPASWPGKKRKAALQGCLQPSVKPDIDNLAKSVLDGLNGLVFEDDSQITRLTVSKTYGAAPGVAVYVSSRCWL